MKLGQLMDIAIGDIFRKYFAWFKGLGYKSRSFLIYQPIAINPEAIMMNFWFLVLVKVCTEAI